MTDPTERPVTRQEEEGPGGAEALPVSPAAPVLQVKESPEIEFPAESKPAAVKVADAELTTEAEEGETET